MPRLPSAVARDAMQYGAAMDELCSLVGGVLSSQYISASDDVGIFVFKWLLPPSGLISVVMVIRGAHRLSIKVKTLSSLDEVLLLHPPTVKCCRYSISIDCL